MDFNQAFNPIRALQSAWKALAQAPLPLILGGVILVLAGGWGSGVQFRSGEHGRPLEVFPYYPLLVGLAGIFCCLAIVCFLVSSWVKIGLANSVEEVLRTGHTEVDHVFQAKGRFVNMIGSRILCKLIGIAATLPFVGLVVVAAILTRGFELRHGLAVLVIASGSLVYLPIWAYVLLGVSLADQAVALEGADPIAAIRRSWSLASGNRLMLFVYWIALFVFTLAGVCLCCVGVFLTGTLARAALSESYLALTRGSERAGWWIEKGFAHPVEAPQGWGAPSPPTPPPPSA